MSRSIGPNLRQKWQRLSSIPGGKWLFSRLVGFTAPYTGSIGANVELLEPGHGVVTLNEKWRVRNHLKSVHAIAMANLAEMVTGLTLMNSLPDQTRGILIGLKIDYRKKACGRLRAECFCAIPADNREQQHAIEGEIRDADGDVVAAATAVWQIGPEKS